MMYDYNNGNCEPAMASTNLIVNVVFLGLSGVYYLACDPYCGDTSNNWPNGVEKTVYFASAFHKKPSVIISVERYGKLSYC